MVETIIAIAVVALAGVLVVVNVYRSLSGKQSGCACSGTQTCDANDRPGVCVERIEPLGASRPSASPSASSPGGSPSKEPNT